MIHLKKSRCGYSEYICTGIPSIPPLLPPVCDSFVYDNSPQSDRTKDNNFLNLPLRFKGIVQSTTVMDIFGVFLYCIKEYNPLLKLGLLDAFKIVALSPTGYLHTYLDNLDCFDSNSSLLPIGILLPSPLLSNFQNVAPLAVPTVALSAAQLGLAGTAYSRAISSGCRGLVISAKAIGSYRLRFSVSTGLLYLQNDLDGLPLLVLVKALNNIVVRGKDNVSSVDVYIVAQYDILTRKWKAVIDYTTLSHLKLNSTPTKWIKRKHLGTIKYGAGRIVDVIQAECGPIDMRDWTSLLKLPARSSGGSRYVFTFGYKGNSALKGWILVRDCG